MLVSPSIVWSVYYRNADGQLRQHIYFTQHHAEQFAHAMSSSRFISEVKVKREAVR